jgi:hypothetical protein
MKRPSKSTGTKPQSVPPGGRAAERLRQDRLARGLASPPKPGILDLEPDAAPDARDVKPAAPGKRR